MQTINMYQTKPNWHDIPTPMQQRMTEVEIFIMYEKLKAYAPDKPTSRFASDVLKGLLNPTGQNDEYQMNLLMDRLTMSDDLIPSQLEYVIYLRLQGLGVNKITAITKKQHYYLKDKLSNFNANSRKAIMDKDFKWDEMQDLKERSHVLASDLFQMDQQTFHATLEFKFPKHRPYDLRNPSYIRTNFGDM